MKNSYKYLCVIVILLMDIAKTSPVQQKLNNSTLNFVILHTNDMHSHFEQSTGDGQCGSNDTRRYGGFARVSHVVKQHRDEASKGGPPVLFLNAGDNYIGTPYFTFFKDTIVTEFMNFLKPDAMALGNHEFILGLQGLLPFLYNASFPVLIANVNNSANHALWQKEKLRNSIVLEVQGIKIGVVGYLTNETQKYTNTGGLQLMPEVDAINKEAEKLDGEGVKIIIALGHSGYPIDKIIARECRLVDIVIGAHSHSFLYSGLEPVTDPITGPYPTVIQQEGGKRVLVVQAYQYTKYMEKLNVTFDHNGDLVDWNGQPIQLNETIPEDAEALKILDKYSTKIRNLQKHVLGVSKVPLDDSKCHLNECNVGNLITDAYVHVRAKQYSGPHWTDAPIALLQGAGIRDSACPGNISLLELTTIIPFNNSLVIVNVTGASLLQAFEHSVNLYPIHYNGFLQMSGVRVAYNIGNPPGQRVKSVQLLCSECRIPTYSELNPQQMYGIVMTKYLHQGGDDHFMFRDFTARDIPFNMFTATREYIEDFGVIYPKLEGRTTLYDGDSICIPCATREKTILL